MGSAGENFSGHIGRPRPVSPGQVKAALDVLKRGHALRTRRGEATALGKARLDNFMWRRKPGTAAEKDEWECIFVDFSWAGIAGKDRYPPVMNLNYRWHSDAGPCLPLQQSHDVHLVNERVSITDVTRAGWWPAPAGV